MLFRGDAIFCVPLECGGSRRGPAGPSWPSPLAALLENWKVTTAKEACLPSYVLMGQDRLVRDGERTTPWSLWAVRSR